VTRGSILCGLAGGSSCASTFHAHGRRKRSAASIGQP
jgi:hypothetical protein